VDVYIHSLICLHGVVLNWLSTGTTLRYILLFSNTKYLFLFLVEKEIACNSRFVDVSNAGGKFSVVTISRPVDLKGDHPPEINYFSQCVT
jgi:hypothetical protein